MLYGILLWLLIMIISIYSRTYMYVDKEHREGIGRLFAVLIGSVLLAVAVILIVKMIFNAI